MKKIIQILANFRDKRIAVIGDLMLDHFIWGDVKRISPEAPVPVVLVSKETFGPGGTANTVNNIKALGGEVVLIDLIGRIIQKKLNWKNRRMIKPKIYHFKKTINKI